MDKKYITFYKKFILQTKTLNDRGVGSTGWFIEPSTQTSSLKKIKSCNKIVENTYDFIERNHV